jgi:predicted ribosomally synthesized peptide with nif11-like leader
MSLQSVNDFLTQVSQDEELMKEMFEAMEADDDRQAVADLAISKGFDLTADELWEEVQRRQAEAPASELTDEELEAVAGGEVKVSLTIAIVSATVGATASVVTGWIPKPPKPKW